MYLYRDHIIFFFFLLSTLSHQLALFHSSYDVVRTYIQSYIFHCPRSISRQDLLSYIDMYFLYTRFHKSTPPFPTRLPSLNGFLQRSSWCRRALLQNTASHFCANYSRNGDRVSSGLMSALIWNSFIKTTKTWKIYSYSHSSRYNANDEILYLMSKGTSSLFSVLAFPLFHVERREKWLCSRFCCLWVWVIVMTPL